MRGWQQNRMENRQSNKMEIQGNVMKLGAVQTGTSKQGNPYITQDVVVEYFEFPTDMWTQKIVITLRGNHVEEYKL